MKMKNLLVAALLLGGMTAFNACSEKDEIDNVTPPTEEPAEALETTLAFTGGFGEELETRAASDEPASSDNGKGSYEMIRNYAEILFEVEDGQPGSVIAYDLDVTGTAENPIFGTRKEYEENNYANGKTDPYGFYFKPLTFKTAKKRVALVVVANCDELFKNTENLKTITDFKGFSEFANSVVLPLLKNTDFGGYPMSSNVYMFDIIPGKYNSVGFGLNDPKGKEELADALKYYKLATEETAAGIVEETNKIDDKRIDLYRCWSLVKLANLDVDIYTKGAKDAKFEFEEAFVMNVPNRTNLFNPEKSATSSNWHAWGGELNISLDSYMKSGTSLFYSGYSDDEKASPKKHSDGWEENPAYDKGFRTAELADATSYFSNYKRSLPEAKIITMSGQPLDCQGDEFEVEGSGFSIDPAMGEDNFFTYIVAPSTYGKDEQGGQVSDQSIVLVVKGKYSQYIENQWIGTGENGEITPSYYTVVVNGSDSQTKIEGVLTKNIQNTVMRNVQYYIDLTVKGPGSPVPTIHLKSTVLVPKISIIPFGTVRQTSEID